MDSRDIGKIETSLADITRQLEDANARLRRIEEGLLFVGGIAVAGALTAMGARLGWWAVVVAPVALFSIAYYVAIAMRRTR